MKRKISPSSRLQIISALTWALVMLGCSYAINLGNPNFVINILIAGATTHFLLLNRITSVTFKERSSCQETGSAKI